MSFRWLARLPARHRGVFWFVGAMAAGFVVLSLGLPPRPKPPSPEDARLAELRARLADGARIGPGRWTMIVVHHSATPSGSAASFDDYHRFTLGWERGLGYHFVIGNGTGSDDGQIEIGPRWVRQEQGAHVKNHNAGAIGICLVGDFDVMLTDPARPSQPTARQMESLVRLTRALLGLCDIGPNGIRFHRDLEATACPGRYFPAETFRAVIAGPTPPR